MFGSTGALTPSLLVRRGCCSFRMDDQPVADTELGANVARLTRVHLELSAQAANVNTQCTRVLATWSPRLFEESGMRHDAIAVAYERLEYAVLQGRQAHLISVEAARDPFGHVDRDVTEFEYTHRQLSAHVTS